MSVEQLSLAHERLSAIEGSGILRHTAARWYAHEDAYPGSGALDMARRCAQATFEARGQIEQLVDELEGIEMPAADLSLWIWVRDELRAACWRLATPTPPVSAPCPPDTGEIAA